MIEETIRQRKSIRSYRKQPLSEADQEYVNELISNIRPAAIFTAPLKVTYLQAKTGSDEQKLGTYGVIRNAPAFLGITVRNTDNAMETVGYQFEKIVLALTEKGIGTCWLAGTFRREQFANALELKEDELFPIVCPIGYPSDKKTFINSAFRTLSKSDQRKPWSELFFKDDFQHPLSQQDAAAYAFPLEMLRLAPSAANGQPWRIVLQNDRFHFYRLGSNKADHPYDLQALDTGIAACHFELAANERKLPGHFEKLSEPDIRKPDNSKYLFTWICD